MTDFLGLDDHPLEAYPVVNPRKERASKGLFNATQKVVQLKNKLGLPGTGLARKVNRLNTSDQKQTIKPPSAAWMQQIHEYFLPDMALLEQVTGRSLNHWKERRFVS